jgi:hypothetical protein
VAGIDDVWAGDARKEVLCAARKADHLMRKDRTTDDQVVVVENAPIEGHLNLLIQQALGQLLDLASRYEPSVCNASARFHA